MKIKELKDNENIEIIKVSKHINTPDRVTIEIPLIETQMITDGLVEVDEKQKEESIENYCINGKKYDYYVDTLKTQNVSLKNHSYVIVYLTAYEYVTTQGKTLWIPIIKDMSVYLSDLKNKKALRQVRQVISHINSCGRIPSTTLEKINLCNNSSRKIKVKRF